MRTTHRNFYRSRVHLQQHASQARPRQFDPPYIAAIFESGEQDAARCRSSRSTKPIAPKCRRIWPTQIPYVRRILEAMRFPILQYPGLRGRRRDRNHRAARGAGRVEVVIVSSDKDMLQLVNERVSMLNPAKDDTWYDPAKVKEFMGVRPDQIADLLALMGDSVDNIPGAPGIGDKGARALLEQFGTVDAAIARAAEVQRKAYRESLQNNAEQIRMSKRLATIATEVPIEFTLDSVKAQPGDPALLKTIYKEMEFYSLLKELGPAEDTRPRDYGVIASPDELREWLAGVPAGIRWRWLSLSRRRANSRWIPSDSRGRRGKPCGDGGESGGI